MERPLEMVKTVLKLLPVLALALSCNASGNYTWEKYVIDGRFTGVTSPNADNVEEALGTVEDGIYFAPNGKVYSEGCVVEAASALIASQEKMRRVKEVIGYAPREMRARMPESELSNMAADIVAQSAAALTGRKVDLGIINQGGIRVVMPKGKVLLDDIESMFPFKNYICYVAVKGSELEYLFEFLARRRRPECLSGVKFVIDGNKVGELLIGGEPLDREKTYGMATIDFLLDGGDSLYLARNAQELIICKPTVLEVVEPYIRNLAAQGKEIEYFTDGRVEIINPEKK